MHPLYEHLMNWNYCYIDLASYYCLSSSDEGCIHKYENILLWVISFSINIDFCMQCSLWNQILNSPYATSDWFWFYRVNYSVEITNDMKCKNYHVAYFNRVAVLSSKLYMSYLCFRKYLLETICCHIKGGNCSTCSQNFQCIFNKREICPVFNLSTVMCSFGVDSFSMYFQLN